MNRQYRSDRTADLRLSVELTDGCNQNCVHCFKSLQKPAKFFDLDLLESIFEQVQELAPSFRVGLTGGEPTLHPELDRVLELVTRRGATYSIVTNGWTFEKVLPLCVEHREGLDAISFSLDSAQAGRNDAIRGEGSFQRAVAGLAACNAHGLPTQINMVMTRQDRQELEAMAMLASNLGCRALGLAHCKLTEMASAAGFVADARVRRHLESDIADLQSVFQLSILLAGDHYDPYPLAQCSQLGLRELHVDVHGRLRMCCELSGYRGAVDDSDVIADLRKTPLAAAVRRLALKAGEVVQAKVARFENGATLEEDRFICTECRRHFGKPVKLEVS